MAILTEFWLTSITGIEEQTASIRTLFLEIPFGYPDFQPGEVIYLRLSSDETNTSLPLKPYCICSLPEDRVIELCVEMVNVKGVSGSIGQSIVGTNFQISKPAGHFIFKKEQGDKSLLFLGFGSGIGVIRGLMRQHYHLGHKRQAVQFYAVNCDDTSIPYEKALEQESDRYPNLEVYPILQTEGYDVSEVMDRVLTHAAPTEQWEIYLAGPTQPLHEMKKQLISVGFSEKQLHHQKYQ